MNEKMMKIMEAFAGYLDKSTIYSVATSNKGCFLLHLYNGEVEKNTRIADNYNEITQLLTIGATAEIWVDNIGSTLTLDERANVTRNKVTEYIKLLPYDLQEFAGAEIERVLLRGTERINPIKRAFTVLVNAKNDGKGYEEAINEAIECLKLVIEA